MQKIYDALNIPRFGGEKVNITNKNVNKNRTIKAPFGVKSFVLPYTVFSTRNPNNIPRKYMAIFTKSIFLPTTPVKV